MRTTILAIIAITLVSCGSDSSPNKKNFTLTKPNIPQIIPFIIPQQISRDKLKLNDFEIDNLDQLKFNSIDSNSISSVKNFE